MCPHDFPQPRLDSWTHIHLPESRSSAQSSETQKSQYQSSTSSRSNENVEWTALLQGLRDSYCEPKSNQQQSTIYSHEVGRRDSHHQNSATLSPAIVQSSIDVITQDLRRNDVWPGPSTATERIERPVFQHIDNADSDTTIPWKVCRKHCQPQSGASARRIENRNFQHQESTAQWPTDSEKPLPKEDADFLTQKSDRKWQKMRLNPERFVQGLNSIHVPERVMFPSRMSCSSHSPRMQKDQSYLQPSNSLSSREQIAGTKLAAPRWNYSHIPAAKFCKNTPNVHSERHADWTSQTFSAPPARVVPRYDYSVAIFKNLEHVSHCTKAGSVNAIPDYDYLIGTFEKIENASSSNIASPAPIFPDDDSLIDWSEDMECASPKTRETSRTSTTRDALIESDNDWYEVEYFEGNARQKQHEGEWEVIEQETRQETWQELQSYSEMDDAMELRISGDLKKRRCENKSN